MKLINKIKQCVPYVYVGYKDYKYMSSEGIRLAKVALKLAEDNKRGWDLSKIANQGFADEIEKLEKEVKKYKRPRNKRGQFMSKSAVRFKRVHDELRAKYGKEMLDDVIGHYDDIKAASKHEEFGR